MGKINTEKADTPAEERVEGQDRFNSFYNGKNQGVVIGVRDPANPGKYLHWIVEGDEFNNTYPSSDLAVVAAAKHNTGREIKLKEKNKRKRKKEKYSK